MGRMKGLILIRCKSRTIAYMKLNKFFKLITKKAVSMEWPRREGPIISFNMKEMKKYYDMQKEIVMSKAKKLIEIIPEFLEKKSFKMTDYESSFLTSLFENAEEMSLSLPSFSTRLFYIERRRKKKLEGHRTVKWDSGIVINDEYYNYFEEENPEWMVKFSIHY